MDNLVNFLSILQVGGVIDPDPTKLCNNKCGRFANKGFDTCCQYCNGIGTVVNLGGNHYNHHQDCTNANLCVKKCGRRKGVDNKHAKIKIFDTCCKKCDGSNTIHDSWCLDILTKQPTATSATTTAFATSTTTSTHLDNTNPINIMDTNTRVGKEDIKKLEPKYRRIFMENNVLAQQLVGNGLAKIVPPIKYKIQLINEALKIISQKSTQSPNIKINNIDFANAIIELLPSLTSTDKIAIVNFANSIYVGGGYQNMQGSQEEELCRCIPTLYGSMMCGGTYVLNEDRAIYIQFDSANDIEYCTDQLFYHMPLDINDKDKTNKTNYIPLKNPIMMDVIIAAAVDLRQSNNLLVYNTDPTRIYYIMEQLIIMMFLTPYIYANNSKTSPPTVLILGAFGCGAFAPKDISGNKDKNYIKTIATIFKECIDKFGHLYKHILFPIYDKDTSDIFYKIITQSSKPAKK